jgi:DnaJ-class molecular chaperone
MLNIPEEVWETCPVCGGTGYVHNGGSFLDEENYEECEYCSGIGEVLEEV